LLVGVVGGLIHERGLYTDESSTGHLGSG
jgi:hypothetical protein